MNPKNFWTKYTFALNQTRVFKVGFEEVYVRHIQNGWLIKNKKSDLPFDEMEIEDVDIFTEDKDTLHFHSGKSHDLYVVPAFRLLYFYI